MNTKPTLNLKTNNCEISELTRFKISRQIEKELVQFPDHAPAELIFSKTDDEAFTFDLSMRYTRGHVAVKCMASSLEHVVTTGLEEFKNNLRIHEFQAAIETFHFDRADEYDYFTEISAASLASPKRKLRTLIVEDDPAASVVLKATLKSLGCEVDHFDLPAEALTAITTKRYDLLVLDWNLPYMKGGDFLEAADRFLKKNDRSGIPNRQVPVVICTSMPLDQIKLPAVSHFFFCNHWHKSLPFSSVMGSLDETTKKITARNQIAA